MPCGGRELKAAPRLDYRKTTSIAVGIEHDNFIVPKAILFTSDYFQAAVNWDKPDEHIHLSDIKSKDFEVYVHWATRQAIDRTEMRNTQQEGLLSHLDLPQQDLIHWLCELWVLGDYLLDVQFCNFIIEELVTALQGKGYGVPPQETYEHVWIHSTPGATLRELLLTAALVVRPTKEDLEALPAEFVRELCHKALHIRLNSIDRIKAEDFLETSA